MTQTTWTEPQTGSGSSSGSSGDFARQERRAAEDLVDDAKVAASETGEQAMKLASEKAEELQGAAASHLRTFADAVRAAGDELAEKEPGPVSDLVRQAAEGLEQFSGALGRKSSSEMLDSVRDFGRQNPVGFLAGTMLAGFALARFAGSDAPQPNSRSGHDDGAHRPADASGGSAGSVPDANDDGSNAAGAASFGAVRQTGGASPSTETERLSGSVDSKARTEV